MQTDTTKPLTPPVNPGGSATATVYDSGAVALNNLDQQRRTAQRVRVAVYVDQAATLNCKWAAPGSSNLRTFNGGGSGETIAASTFFERDVLLMPGRNQITIVTGTIPTVWEVGAECILTPALGQ